MRSDSCEAHWRLSQAELVLTLQMWSLALRRRPQVPRPLSWVLSQIARPEQQKQRRRALLLQGTARRDPIESQ